MVVVQVKRYICNCFNLLRTTDLLHRAEEKERFSGMRDMAEIKQLLFKIIIMTTHLIFYIPDPDMTRTGRCPSLAALA